ncbi:MAG: hypothetical protein Q8M76_00980 [Spirochaetaceae bacterium]|nr:hypothetical protein [Spirochaetaceae bacterium]
MVGGRGEAREAEFALPGGDQAWSGLYGLLQAGIALESRAGLSLREFMRETLFFPDPYIEGAVSTVFLDGKPVDDIDSARVGEGSLVALSAAMPGLVGAVMRRNSPYASFRESITYGAGAEGGSGLRPGGDGRDADAAAGREAPRCAVRVKLFNSVMRDRGPDILSRGVIVSAGEAESALGKTFSALRETKDGGALAETDLVRLRIVATDGETR